MTEKRARLICAVLVLPFLAAAGYVVCSQPEKLNPLAFLRLKDEIMKEISDPWL